jgi:hypothetical protein
VRRASAIESAERTQDVLLRRWPVTVTLQLNVTGSLAALLLMAS